MTVPIIPLVTPITSTADRYWIVRSGATPAGMLPAALVPCSDDGHLVGNTSLAKSIPTASDDAGAALAASLFTTARRLSGQTTVTGVTINAGDPLGKITVNVRYQTGTRQVGPPDKLVTVPVFADYVIADVVALMATDAEVAALYAAIVTFYAGRV
jgi:hypothetical protein